MEPGTIQGARQRGRDFEAIFEKLATLQGLLARKIPLSCRIIPGGGYIPVYSELDWQLVDHGRIALIDTKSCQDERIFRSELSDHQVDTAALMNSWGISAGFCVWFRKVDKVVYLTGREVKKTEVGSFGADDGTLLGTGFDFSLKKIFNIT